MLHFPNSTRNNNLSVSIMSNALVLENCTFRSWAVVLSMALWINISKSRWRWYRLLSSSSSESFGSSLRGSSVTKSVSLASKATS
jgi:hypothetical protein